MPTNPDSVHSVLITGASSGIGRTCALHMDRLGWRVFAGVRRQQDGDSLRADASPRLLPVVLDVTRPQQIRHAVEVVERIVGAAGLTGLVNNAGIAYGGPIEFLDLERIRQAFDVNFFGIIAVTQAFIPLLRTAGGRLVNVSSISGLIAAPFLSPYTTSKFALEALSDALRVELSPWQIRVVVVEPGAVRTPIWDKSARLAESVVASLPSRGVALYHEALETFQAGLVPHGIPVEAVARAVARALTSPRPATRYRTGLDGFLVGILRSLPDSLRDRFFLSRYPRWG